MLSPFASSQYTRIYSFIMRFQNGTYEFLLRARQNNRDQRSSDLIQVKLSEFIACAFVIKIRDGHSADKRYKSASI